MFLQVNIVANAVQKDQNGEYKEAIKLYCDSLGYFIPAIHCKSHCENLPIIQRKYISFIRSNFSTVHV